MKAAPAVVADTRETAASQENGNVDGAELATERDFAGGKRLRPASRHRG
jgi:hypothetical protein